MAHNLRDRLRRIQEQKKIPATEHQAIRPPKRNQNTADISFFKEQGWDSHGFLTLKREVTVKMRENIGAELPPALMILVPDLDRMGKSGREAPKTEDFLFFDLETSGLSGGAGTVAFLAAFGRFTVKKNGLSLRITQYLLLDYPGENDFIEALLAEFDNQSIITSYNGKCFDSQILKTRCLMHGIQPPEYFHADLLHPARRLWKTLLENCSQSTIETEILGLDRGGDTPGAMAPDIWFDFLKTGEGERLMGICDHNCRDISGLAAIFSAMVFIAKDPIRAAAQYRYDIEQIALRWRYVIRNLCDKRYEKLRITVTELLRLAAERRYPRASLAYAQDQLRGGNVNEGRKLLLGVASGNFPENIRAAGLRSLAIDSERRLGNAAEALEFARQGMKLQLTSETWQKEFERRAERLTGRI